MKKHFYTMGVLVLSLFIGLYSCATNPVTQKEQFVLMSEEQELSIGRSMDPKIIKEYGLYDNPELQSYVDMIGQKIAKKGERPELFYHFKVLNDSIINAFALPGGYIYITRGILALLNSEAELAGVLGHEIGHVTARHAVQQYTQAQGYQIMATVASIFVPDFRSRELQQLADIAATGIIRGYGREMEMESDRLGIKYSYKARYNPKAVPDFLSVLKLASKGKEENGVFHGMFDTHPDTRRRINAAKKKVNDLLVKKKSKGLSFHTDRYLNQIEGLIYGSDPKEGVINGMVYQHPVMHFEITYPKGWKIFNTRSAVISKDKEKDEKYVSQLLAETLGKRISTRNYAKKFFKRNRIKPLSEKNEEINGLEAYVTTFQDTQRKAPMMVMAAFILWQDKMFFVSGSSKVRDFRTGKKFFTQIIDSFRGLSKEEVNSIKPERIKIYVAEEGDTIKSVAKKYAKEPQTIALINGYEKDTVALEAGKKIKVLANY
ncbi:MAG: M48 family metalloprotease [Nitrospinota bacterium]|jgi:predicted Zn-dependent protease|nr:M48 family metalloprotease [Nitrospinota bacterium]HJN02622.1 M48 family metalloprotease [Nitrospinota bacterium]